MGDTEMGEKIRRRSVIAGGLAASLLGSRSLAGTAEATVQENPRLRMIATEEAFATPELLELQSRGGPGITQAEMTYVANRIGGAQSLPRRLTSIEARLEEMDRNQLDMHLLSVTVPGPQGLSMSEGPPMARQLNDWLAGTISRHPTRFAGLACLPLQDVPASVLELRRAKEQLHLNGIIINSHIYGEYLDNDRFRPVLEAAQDLDMTIYLHPRVPAQQMVEPYMAYGLSGALWGFAADTSLHAMRIIMKGVFDDFPRLRLVLGHMGEGIPYYFSRIDNRYAALMEVGGASFNMRRLEKLPSQYFRSNIYITTSGVFDHRVLDFCIGAMGADRILFAVDYPYETTAPAVEFMRTARLSRSDAELIAHRTAERIFGIPPITYS
jgi:5-carboxyvanillate decarboxylase